MVNYIKITLLTLLFGTVTAQAATVQDFFSAISGQKISKVKKLTKELGANVQDENGETPLMAAAQAPLRGLFILSGRKNRKIIKYLIDHKANVNQKDNEGRTALHYHVNKYTLYKYDQKKLDLFLKAGAAVDENDIYGNSPLLLLSKIALPHNPNGGYHVEIAAKLLSLGADVNGVNMTGETPLLAASENGNLKMVELLLKKGANAKFVDSDGLALPARVARDHNVQSHDVNQILCLLIKAGADSGDLSPVCK
ncbi:MAG: ankyrin repeat domain-containing protein [Bdellovibrio sp.]|nr:ankyrin repeat domain-containing protein [Bdellovibrio sp.]